MRFPIIYCDPPWEYNDRRAGQGGAANYYNLASGLAMENWGDQFLAMRPNSGVMLMWVTGPHYETAPALMRSWGYTPIKPVFYWVKTYPGGTDFFYGPGAYTGSNVEYILLGQANTNKPFTPANSGGEKGVSEVIYRPHPRDRSGKIIHSRKPAIFRDLIVKLWGDHLRVEVFAREQAPGWHAIGDQLPGGQAIRPGEVIDPLPPPDFAQAATRLFPGYEQRPLLDWGA